jgi:hypothetical protein
VLKQPPKKVNMDVTPHGFNLKDATLDEKMDYLQSLYKKMNRNYAINLGIATGVKVNTDPSQMIKNNADFMGEKTAKEALELEGTGRTGSVNADRPKTLLAPLEKTKSRMMTPNRGSRAFEEEKKEVDEKPKITNRTAFLDP